jgi:hypothetical protein
VGSVPIGYDVTMNGPALPIFELFPEIKQLGAEKLQSLCNAWLPTPVAKEFALTMLQVVTVDDKLSLAFDFGLTHDVQDGESYYFPTDELLLFIADNAGLTPAVKAELVRKIIAGRRAGGPDVYRRFVIHPGPKLPLFITCKNSECLNVMQTQFTAYRNEKTTDMEPEEIECPRCRHKFTLSAGDFHFEPGA